MKFKWALIEKTSGEKKRCEHLCVLFNNVGMCFVKIVSICFIRGMESSDPFFSLSTCGEFSSSEKL